MNKKLGILLSMLVVVPLAMAAAAAGPSRTFGVRRVSNITTTAATVNSLTGLNCSCGFYIKNSTADQLNVGGTDVDNSTKFTSVCSSGCDETNPIVVYGDGAVVSLRGAGGTVAGPVVIWCAGGCQ